MPSDLQLRGQLLHQLRILRTRRNVLYFHRGFGEVVEFHRYGRGRWFRLIPAREAISVRAHRATGGITESAFDTDGDGYDMIILDSHLNDIGGLDLARRIHEKMPNQRIVLTTTLPLVRLETSWIQLESIKKMYC